MTIPVALLLWAVLCGTVACAWGAGPVGLGVWSLLVAACAVVVPWDRVDDEGGS